MIDNLKSILVAYLKTFDEYGLPEYLDAGGSAAVFRVPHGDDFRVFKVFNPALFNGEEIAADRRRLDVQRRLIGHNCPTLVQTYRIEETNGTAIMEMEYIPWPQLKSLIPYIPDESIVSLITQLVTAVKYLEELNIVHRDIKPENIHVTDDFTKLKLLDLGVVREFDEYHVDEAAISDHGNKRPFLATAQYSSPEYLFRLDEPTEQLWKGLNFYQIGAVLHDLIMKKPIFHHEMELHNRWLVAKAVLVKTPSFSSLPPDKLPHLRSLASRCLVKDLDARLNLIGWDDFILDGAEDPLTALRGKLDKGIVGAGEQANTSHSHRLEFERNNAIKSIKDGVRAALIDVCGTQLPLVAICPVENDQTRIKFVLNQIEYQLDIACYVVFEWKSGLYERTADVQLAAEIINESDNAGADLEYHIVCTCTTSEGRNEVIICLSQAIARLVGLALDLIVTNTDKAVLHHYDLQRNSGV
ncbi:MAG: protein kinase [Gammaproteobacteria bacterium]|nr:protein kinase [Gammaproteobacteria bacterium]